MIGPYILFGSVVIGFLLGALLTFRSVPKQERKNPIVYIIGAIGGMFVGMLGLLMSLVVCCIIDAQMDFMKESSPDDERIAAMISLVDFEDIEVDIKVSDLYFIDIECEVYYKDDIVAPLARRRKTVETYQKLKQKYETLVNRENTDLYQERVNSIIKNHLEGK